MKPTLRHIFLNKVDECNENECEQCEHHEHDAGDSDINSNTCRPPSSECTNGDENDCDAAERIFNNYMDDYLELKESLDHE